jgi:hypothetical protein
MPGEVTDHLQLLLAELHTNEALRADFVVNPANAIAPFDLTSHEAHAVLKRDCDDFVALEAVASTNDLPDLFACPSGGGGGFDLSDLLDALRDRFKDLLDPKVPDLDRPIPPPEPPDPGPIPPPGPGPHPTPRPTPGPDPPDPDAPGPRRRGEAESSPPDD